MELKNNDSYIVKAIILSTFDQSTAFLYFCGRENNVDQLILVSPPVDKAHFLELVLFILSLMIKEIGDSIDHWKEESKTFIRDAKADGMEKKKVDKAAAAAAATETNVQRQGMPTRALDTETNSKHQSNKASQKKKTLVKHDIGIDLDDGSINLQNIDRFIKANYEWTKIGSGACGVIYKAAFQVKAYTLFLTLLLNMGC